MDKVVYFKSINDDDRFMIMAYIQVSTDIIDDMEEFLKNLYHLKAVEVLEIVDTVWQSGIGWNTAEKRHELEDRYKNDPLLCPLNYDLKKV